MNLFFATLSQIAYLFTLILIGYLLVKTKVVASGAASVLAKLENTVFIPALVLETFIDNFTPKTLSTAGRLLGFSFLLALVFIGLALLCSRFLAKDRYTRNIYTYGLAFSNFGFMGNAVVKALFPDLFFEYILFTIPLWILIYLWAVPALLLPSDEKLPLSGRLRNLINPMFISMIVGMLIGLIGIPVPSWLRSAVSVSSGCMSPVAMLLTGMTICGINFRKIFTDRSIYLVSLIRLIGFPLLFIGFFHWIPLPEPYFTLGLCTLAMPLGLNTIVIPSAYGKDTSAASGMRVVSCILSCFTIPLMIMIALS